MEKSVSVLLSFTTLLACVNAQTTALSARARTNSELGEQRTNGGRAGTQHRWAAVSAQRDSMDVYEPPLTDVPMYPLGYPVPTLTVSDSRSDATTPSSVPDASWRQRVDALEVGVDLSSDANVRLTLASDASMSPAETLLTNAPPVQAVDEYCRSAMVRGYRRRECQQTAVTHGHPTCYCGQLPRSGAAPASFTGRASLQQPAGPFEAAYVMARSNNPDRPVNCDLLLRTPAGLFAFASIDTCAAPTASTNPLPSMSVRSMRATAPSNGAAEFVVNWDAVTANPANANGACRVARQISCAVDPANIPSCVLRQTSPVACTTP